MNCKELAYMLADYFDGSMDPRLREELDAHLAMCEPCRVFTSTYQAVTDKTRLLRRLIEYEIPPEVRERLETFVRAAALKYPEKVREYREQVERDRREKVADLVRAAIAGTLSSAAALLMESHCAACPECREYFGALRKTSNLQAGDPPEGIRSHVIALMQTLPPGEEYFLA
ncbi:zf-HC2 domain-containing protein [Candidatus Deferrimicrobium sp.]|uniref:anti-sigma factor family protein n=1 Tax=Candidatus Deferrimicrobium sp. TaxID=3060586 RepID=UPI003C591277